MPSKQIIHSREDIESLVQFADSIGILMLPQDLVSKDSTPWKPEQFTPFSGVTIVFFRPQWVVGDIPLLPIKRGVDAGTFTVQYGINMSAVSIYFSGDADVNGIRRLGAGEISFKRDYLAEPAHEMRPAPPDVEVVYKQLCKHLLSNVVARGGVHRYHVCKEAAELARRTETRPPFDYIEWPPPDLHKKSTRKGSKTPQ